MMNDVSKDLKLCGEQINLINRANRSADELRGRSDVNKFRPHSALHSHNKNKTEHGRRPFSAGTEPTSSSLCSFLRYTKKSEFHEQKNSESFRDFVSIPGTAESALLFERLIRDPVDPLRRSKTPKERYAVSKHVQQSNDETSENGSVDTCVSLGTKIKSKAQTFDRLSHINENYEISGYSITLKKSKVNGYTRDMLPRGDSPSAGYETKRAACQTPDKEPSGEIMKLSVYVPNVKDENTSSGVSSSSDVLNSTGLRAANADGESNINDNSKIKAGNYFYRKDLTGSKKNERNSEKSDSLAGRVSFGKSSVYEDPMSLSDNDQYDMYSAFNTQLSLVEEESSQDSDESSKYISQDKKVRSANIVDEYERKFSLKNHCDVMNKSGNEYKNNFMATTIEDENEKKFIELEKKYMDEKYGLSDYVRFNRESYEQYPINNDRLSRDCSVQNEVILYDRQKNNKSDQSRTTSDYTDYKNNDYSFKNNECNEEYSIKKENYVQKIPEILIENVPDKSSADLSKEGQTLNCINETKDTIGGYPSYLTRNDSKSYTSKVIEEYRKEISEINNFHNLTIKDLRKKCDDLKGYMQNDTPEPLKKVILSSSEENDDGDEVTLSEYERRNSAGEGDRVKFEIKSQNNFGSVISKESLIHKFQSKGILNDAEKKMLASHIEKYKGNETKPKLKKKCRKKESTRVIRSEPKQSGVKKESDKKFVDTLNRKVSRRLSKFKPQKIALSKGTKFNNSSYAGERDVQSWMTAKEITPFDDNERENNDNHQSDSGVEKSAKTKTASHANTVHFESDIVPVLKDQPIDKSKTCRDGVEKKEVETSSYMMNTDTNPNDSNCTMLTDRSNNTLPSIGENFSLNNFESDNYKFNDWINDANFTEYFSQVKEKIDERASASRSKDECEDTMTAEYKDIISFLENVEKSANDDMTSLSHNQPLYSLKVEELMDLSKAELAHRAVVGTLAASKAATTAASLREALAKAAKASSARIKIAKATAKHEATVATSKLTQTIAKHQKFIEQLVNEKKALTERIEQLAASAASAEARHNRAARVAAERLQLELRNQRQRLSVAHQRDRQAWLKHHTQKIKEATVKGLEVELQEIEKKHTSQIKKIQQSGENALDELRVQHAKEIKKLKDAMLQQLEDELDKERLLANERLEKKRLEWEVALAGANERADSEVREAARRSEEMVKNARLQADMWRLEQEKELAYQRNLIEKQAEEKRAILMEEMSSLKRKLTDEFEEYKSEYNRKQQQKFKDRELEIKSIMRSERDKEIEKAIDNMELEAEAEKREMQDTLKRIKEKYDVDMKLLEESEKLACERSKELRDQLREIQELYASSQVIITQLEGKLKQAQELRTLNEKHTEVLIKAAEARSKENEEEHRNQLMTLQQQHKEEMHQLFAKVKVVVARKDDAVTLARREATELRERCIKLEAKKSPNF